MNDVDTKLKNIIGAFRRYEEAMEAVTEAERLKQAAIDAFEKAVRDDKREKA